MTSNIMKAALAALIVAAAACSKTDDGRIVVKSPGEVDVKTRVDTITPPKINTPKITTEKETLIVNKPVIKKP